jgi:hypothetical protein
MRGAFGLCPGTPEPFVRSVTIHQAENGVIVTTMHEVEVQLPMDMAPEESWKGPQSMPVASPKTHVFTSNDDALKFVKAYLEGKATDGNS